MVIPAGGGVAQRCAGDDAAPFGVFRCWDPCRGCWTVVGLCRPPAAFLAAQDPPSAPPKPAPELNTRKNIQTARPWHLDAAILLSTQPALNPQSHPARFCETRPQPLIGTSQQGPSPARVCCAGSFFSTITRAAPSRAFQKSVAPLLFLAAFVGTPSLFETPARSCSVKTPAVILLLPCPHIAASSEIQHRLTIPQIPA